MMTFSPASSPRKSFTRFPWGAIQAGLEPNSFVTWANGYFGTNSPLDEVSSYTVSNNNFDGFTGNDISDVLASYSFAGNSEMSFPVKPSKLLLLTVYDDT